MNRILITGGLGNLGAWLTRHFCEKNWFVSVLGTSFKPILPNYIFDFIQCDITDIEQCKFVLQSKKFDVVIHAASFNDTFLKDYALKSLQINTLGTRNILESIDKTSLRNFIYISTFHVYGNAIGEITEFTPTAPKHDYASTHLFGEIYVEQFNKTNNLPYTIIRLTNSYGCPIEINSNKWYLVLNDLAKMAVEKEQIVLKSNGNPSRDFIWMGDVCGVFEKLSGLTTAPNSVFNLSGETSYTMLEIAEKIQKAYLDVFKKEILIKVNENDKNIYPKNIFVNSNKLKKIVPFVASDNIINEAKKIFELLS